jgi:predicted unusual protein kinase regulating ubiquinone biosynthesis (AarF/ABC1/UbiB family)
MARIGRLVAGQGARTAGGRVADRARSPEARQKAESARYARVAEEIVEQLGQMKGAAMKLGQVLASVDFPNLEPEDRDRLRGKLAALRDQAPRVSFGQMEKLMAAEWGARPSRVLAELDTEAAAAASIGQVYRGVTHEGREVAIKVQYPGIAEAVESDLRAATLLVPLLRRMAPGLDGRAVLGELRERISEELDYELEAQHQRRVARAWRDHPHVLVPGVDTTLSTRRVLVTDWVHARDFRVMRELPDAERDRLGEILYRFFFATAAEHGLALGDPHPGNVMLAADGRLVVLDFGLLRELPPEYLEREADVHRAIGARDAAGTERALRALGYLNGPVDAGLLLQHMRLAGSWLWDAEQPLRLSGEYANALGRRIMAQGRPVLDMLRGFDVPAEALLLRRMDNLVFTVLCDLRAAADWGAVAGELRAGLPATTPLGMEHAAWRERRGVSPRPARAA